MTNHKYTIYYVCATLNSNLFFHLLFIHLPVRLYVYPFYCFMRRFRFIIYETTWVGGLEYFFHFTSQFQNGLTAFIFLSVVHRDFVFKTWKSSVPEKVPCVYNFFLGGRGVNNRSVYSLRDQLYIFNNHSLLWLCQIIYHHLTTLITPYHIVVTSV